VAEESDLRSRIEGRLRDRGALVKRVNDAYIIGLPDTDVLIDGTWANIEFKATRGVLSGPQKLWLHNIAVHGGVAIEVRADAKGAKPWRAKYRRMGPKGDWISDYISIDSDLWLEREIRK
jgi:hypothetical protein